MPDDVRESGTLVLRSSNVKNGEIVEKLKSDDRQVIVTTIQKLHILITKKL